MIQLILAALLHLYPHFPTRACIEQRADLIVQQAANASFNHHVPPELLLAVGFHETHLGCDGESDWGAPIDRHHRHAAGTPDDAARALQRSYEVCRGWEGAVRRFRSGLCTLPRTDPRNRYVASVLRLAGRIGRGEWSLRTEVP